MISNSLPLLNYPFNVSFFEGHDDKMIDVICVAIQHLTMYPFLALQQYPHDTQHPQDN